MSLWDDVVGIVGTIPVFGHVTAAVQYFTGDEEGARKSLAASTGNIFSSAGAIGGFMLAGPPGAVACGAAGAALGGQIENKINGKDLDFRLEKIGVDAVAGGLAGIPGVSGFGQTLRNLERTASEAAFKAIAEVFGVRAAQTVARTMSTLVAHRASQLVLSMASKSMTKDSVNVMAEQIIKKITHKNARGPLYP